MARFSFAAVTMSAADNFVSTKAPRNAAAALSRISAIVLASRSEALAIFWSSALTDSTSSRRRSSCTSFALFPGSART